MGFEAQSSHVLQRYSNGFSDREMTVQAFFRSRESVCEVVVRQGFTVSFLPVLPGYGK